jgi:hypothetical protein
MKMKLVYVSPVAEVRRVLLEGVVAGTFKTGRMQSLNYLDGYDDAEVEVSENVTIVF